MSIDYYEQRPPKVAAIKLDFLNDPADQVAAKLRELPGVYDVSVRYGDDGSRCVFLSENRELLPGFWLVSIPSDRLFIGDNDHKILTDEEFNEKYRAADRPTLIGTMNYYGADSPDSE